jgi:uncharacterized protein YjiK
MPRISDVGFRPAAPRRAADSAPARFEAGAQVSTGMTEASDVAVLPGGRFIVVGDRRDAACIVDATGKKELLELPGLKNGKSQLEGVAYDPVRKHLFVSREESRELLRYEWDATKKGAVPVLEKTIDVSAGGPSNKGIEGLAYLPQSVSPTGEPQLLLAKEGKPRELSLLGDGGKGKPLPIKLEKEVLAVCRDFSAATVDPRTGHLFVSSDESATVAQVRLVRDGDKVRGQLVQAIPMRSGKDKPLARIEGLTFNERGDLFVLTENDGKLHQLTRK